MTAKIRAPLQNQSNYLHHSGENSYTLHSVPSASAYGY